MSSRSAAGVTTAPAPAPRRASCRRSGSPPRRRGSARDAISRPTSTVASSARAVGGSSWSGTPAVAATSRIRSASSPSPLATQAGAEPLARLHFSATATWVGLTMTTSAFGTSSSIRLVAIASARLRRCAFMCGSPSDCLFSSRMSWKDMRSRRAWSKRCQTRSMPATVHGDDGGDGQQHHERVHQHGAEDGRLGGARRRSSGRGRGRGRRRARTATAASLTRLFGELDDPGQRRTCAWRWRGSTGARASAGSCRRRR